MKQTVTKMRKALAMLVLMVPLLFVGSVYSQNTYIQISSNADLEEGYYVITNNAGEFAMSNSHNGTFLAPEAVTPDDGVITDPGADLIWKLESTENGWTIYNEDGEVYVSQLRDGNNVDIVATIGEDDFEFWNIEYDAGNGEYVFTNEGRPARILSYNSGAPRFASYTNRGQQQLSLFKQGEVPELADVVFDPAAGSEFHEVPFEIEVTSPDGGDMYYTLDGSVPDENSNLTTGTITITEPEDATVRVIAIDGDDFSAVVTAEYTYRPPFSTTIPFAPDMAEGLGLFYNYSVEGITNWSSETFDGGIFRASGFRGDPVENKWLAFPVIDFTNTIDPTLSFETYLRFGEEEDGDYFRLVYSTDYSGVGDPTEANWTELTFDKAPLSGGNASGPEDYTPSGIIDLSEIEGEAVLAFEYRYSTGNTARWDIRNIQMEQTFTEIASFDLLTPEVDTLVTVTGSGDTEVEITWEEAVSDDDVLYTFQLDSIDGDFSDPVEIDSIETEALTLTYNDIDDILDGLGVAVGDTLVAKWRVIADAGNNAIVSDSEFTITFVRDLLDLTFTPFSLLSPANETDLLVQGAPEDEVEIEWEATFTGNDDVDITYVWQLDAATGDFSDPVAEVSAGTDTTLALAFSVIDNVLAGEGLDEGDEFEGKWRVVATQGLNDVASTEEFELNLTRGTLNIEIAEFELNAPADGTELVVGGESRQAEVEINWIASVANVSVDYTFMLTAAADTDFDDPVLTVENAADTSFTLTFGAIEELLQDNGLDVGDTFNGIWTVFASASGNTVYSSDTFTLDLELGTFLETGIVYSDVASEEAENTFEVGTDVTYNTAIVLDLVPELADAHGEDSLAVYIGYSDENTNPSTWPDSVWVAADFQVNQNDTLMYSADLGAGLPAGSYWIASKATVNERPSVYGGIGGFWDADDNSSIAHIIQEVAATPVFSVAGGYQAEEVEVEITSDTGNASIYYTMDGSDPTSSSTLYDGAISIDSTTTLKAIAIADGFFDSSVASATYEFAVELESLVDLRDAELGVIYTITDEVILYHQYDFRWQKYIVDETSGMLIDDSAGLFATEGEEGTASSFNIGDGLTGVTGRLGIFNGLLQFVPVTADVEVTSTGNFWYPAPATPESITLENTSNVYLLEGVQFDAEPGATFSNNANYTVTYGDSTYTLRTHRMNTYEAGFDGEEIPTEPVNMIAYVGAFNSPQITPLFFDDMGASSAIGSFSLTGPANEAEVVIDGLETESAQISWEVASGSDIEYTWIATVAGLEFFIPAFDLLSDDDGTANTLTLPFPLLDEILEEVGLVDGESITLSWTVLAENDVTAKYADQVWEVTLTKGTITDTEHEVNIPREVSLSQNYPNPFNPTTQIQFGVPADAQVNLVVYDVLGRQVATLVNDNMSAGFHTVSFDANRMASGLYIYRLQAGNTVLTRKMMLVK